MNITLEPPALWESLCQKNNNLFQSVSWQHLLNSAFSSKTIYVFNDVKDGITITIFKAGPFRIGYVGFPVGGSISGNHFSEHKYREIKLDLPVRLDLLRIPVSPFVNAKALNMSCSEVYETAITELQEWDGASLSKSVRSSIKRAKKSEIKIMDIEESDSHMLYKLYHETIKKHHGSLRYNEKYFKELVRLSSKLDNLRVMVALYEGLIIGFIVVGLHNSTAYYLHGAINQEYKRLCASDLLLYTAIEWAKSTGMDVFNLMTSPLTQPGLVHYKEKWKGVTRIHKTYEMNISPLNSSLFRLIMPIYGSIASIFSR